MKKLITIFIGLAMVVSLAACAPKEMPAEKAEASYVLSDTLNSEGKLVLNVGEEYTYNFKTPVEECEVSVESQNPAIKAYVDNENKELTIVAKDAVEGEINLTFAAEGYSDTIIPISVSVQLVNLDFSLELAENNDERIVFEGDVIKVPVGETVNIEMESLEGTQFAIKENVDGVDVNISDNILSITPKSATTSKLNIVADKDTNYTTSEKTIDVVGVATVNVGLSAQQLSLLPGEKATVTFTTDAEGDVKAVVKSGDAKAEVLAGAVQITGGQKPSKIEVRAGSPGWITGTKEINVTVKELPKEKAPEKTADKTVEKPAATPEKSTAPKEVEVKKDSAEQTLSKSVDTSDYDDDIAGIIKYTNKMREEAGLPKLQHVTVVDTPATLRAEEASEQWSHTRPDGTMYYTMFGECGLSYGTNGENLFMANAYLTPKQVVDEWMGSKGHRENILREEFTGIGVGCFEVDGEVYWCQLFVA